MKFRIGIDLGGTSAKIACVTGSGRIVRETSVSTAGFPRPTLMVDEIVLAIRRLLGKDRPSRIGVGVAGDIDSRAGVVRVSPNLGWRSVPLKPLLSRHFACPIVVDNDANAAAWGVYHTQIPKSVQDVAIMTLGTGVGGGLIINGRLYRGATGSAGEIGHLNIDRDGPLCNCGNRGCLETYVGGPHLVAKARKLSTKFRSREKLSPYDLALAARAGDKVARLIWNDAGRALGIAIGDLVYLLNLQMICFTGGVAQAGPLLLKPMWKALRERAFKTPVNAVAIKVARNAPNIGVIGASLL